ncbi:fatty acid hydroxylase superfamily protein [Colletotrichum incanum]|nr:fatty acid hydroxylase superfamily protein [Colletotrichum incanum]
MNQLIDQYPAGYIEVFGSVCVQLVYMIIGLFMEWMRPHYVSATSQKMITQSLKNHIVATMVHIAYVIFVGGKSVLTRTFIQPYNLPIWKEFVSDILIGLLLREAIFYVVHRLWHIPGIFERVHAKHHEIKHPANHHVWTISYMSVVDFLFLYGFPVMAAAKALEMNVVTTLAFALLSAVGEQIKLLRGDDAHDEHHLTMVVNYGAYGLMDRFCGTSSGWYSGVITFTIADSTQIRRAN